MMLKYVTFDHFQRHFSRREERVSGYLGQKHGIYNLPLHIDSAGFSRWGPTNQFQRKRSELFGIEMVTAGNAFFMQNGQEYLVLPGQAFLLQKQSWHIYRPGPARFLHKRYITITGPLLEPMLRAVGLWEEDVVIPSNTFCLSLMLKKASRLLSQKKPGFAFALSRLAYEMLVELGRTATTSFPTPVRRTMEFINQNLTSPPSALHMARAAGLSITHLNRLFARHLKTSPVRFFIAQKMDWARHLLRESGMSVKEVAATVGYDDPLYFSAQFKKQAGCSPKKYRKDSREEKLKIRKRVYKPNASWIRTTPNQD